MIIKLTFAALAVALLSASVSVAQTVTVTPKKVKYTRPNATEDFKKSFEVTYPVVKAKTPALSKKIEAALSYKSNLDIDPQDELKDSDWLEEATFEVEYNKNGILVVSLNAQGTAAYPDSITKRVVIDTATGSKLNSADLFVNTAALAKKLDVKLQDEIKKAKVDIKKDPENNDIDPNELFQGKKFTAADITNFTITDKGITFRYSYDFVHAILALEPAGEFPMTWAEIKPFIKKGGLLEGIAK